MNTVYRTLHYRNASFLTPTRGITLQHYLKTALGQLPAADSRERKMADNERALLNTTAPVGVCLCGELNSWIHGQNQLIVERVAGASSWKVQEVAPPAAPVPPGATAPTQRDFLPHTLYFGVYGDHCVVAQSQGLQSAHLARYLTWLLRDNASALLPPEQQVELNPASAALLRSKGVSRAKGIKVRGSLIELVDRKPTGLDGRRKPWIEKRLNHAKAEAVARVFTLLGLPVPPEALNIEEAKELELYLEVTKPRDNSEHGNSAMTRLANIVAENPSNDFSVVLPDNSELRGDQLKLKQQVSFELKDGQTHPAPASVFKEIDAYMRKLIASNMV